MKHTHYIFNANSKMKYNGSKLYFLLGLFVLFCCLIPISSTAQTNTDVEVKKDSIEVDKTAQEEAKESETEVQNTPNIFDKEHSTQFANYLFKSAQYKLAVNEYERVLFFDLENDSIKLQILRSLSLGNQTEKAITRAERLYKSSADFPAIFAKEYSGNLFKSQKFRKIPTFLKENKTLEKRDKYFLYSCSSLYQMDWELSQKTIEQLNGVSSIDGTRSQKLLESGQAMKFKSPGLAMAMSAVIPGSGKVYTKDVPDAIFSLLVIAGNAYQAYKGFSDKGTKSVRGWVFGTIALGFYAGNIYGSHKAAKVYNQRISDEYRNNVNTLFDKYY